MLGIGIIWYFGVNPLHCPIDSDCSIQACSKGESNEGEEQNELHCINLNIFMSELMAIRV